jgi:hypothetical protein
VIFSLPTRLLKAMMITPAHIKSSLMAAKPASQSPPAASVPGVPAGHFIYVNTGINQAAKKADLDPNS